MSHPKRLFLKDFEGTISPGDIVPFPEDSKKHFFSVLRCTPGDELTLVHTLSSTEFRVQLTESKELLIIEAIASEEVIHPVASLCIGLCKGKKNEFIIEKAVELGVRQIFLLQAEHSVLDLRQEARRRNRIQRWQKIADQASAQSYKKRLSSVTYASNFAAYAQMLDEMSSPNDLRIVCSTENDSKELKSMGLIKSPVHLLIGPEGDFAFSELEACRALYFTPVSLGPWILRSETAAITAIAQVLALCE